jgi:hypothetical protein
MRGREQPATPQLGPAAGLRNRRGDGASATSNGLEQPHVRPSRNPASPLRRVRANATTALRQRSAIVEAERNQCGAPRIRGGECGNTHKPGRRRSGCAPG